MKHVFGLFSLVVLLVACSQKETVTIYVSDFGLKPGSKENAVPAIIKAVNVCKKYPASILIFEKGRYDFWPDSTHVKEYFESNTTVNNPKKLGVLLYGCKGLTLDGGGADFIFHGAMQPFTVDSSENIIIRNVNIDWDIPLTAQGKVLETSSRKIDLKIDTVQFPYEIANGKLIFTGENWKAESRWFMEYEAETHRIAPGTGDAGCVRGDWSKYFVEELSPGTVRMNGEFTRTPAVGNYLILRHSERDHASIFIQDSKAVALENVNVYHCAGLGTLSQFSRDLTFVNVRFIPNAAKNRYLSGHDDGFHVSNCAGQVKILNCEFGGLMDDPINVHGTSVRITERINDTKLKCRFMHEQSTGMNWGHPNDTVGFIESQTMQTLAKGVVKNFEKLKRDEFLVELEEPVPVEVVAGYALENLTWAPDVTIMNCKFGSCRARGLLVSTPGKVLIDGNEFESSGSAILISGDANGWYESGAVTNVTISNNVFKDACLTSMYQFCEAVISIDPVIPAVDSLKPFHRNITIEGNTFHAFDYPVLYALSVDGLRFSNNRIIRSHQYQPFHYRKHFLTFEACLHVEVKGNVFEGDVLAKDIYVEKMDPGQVSADLEIFR
ncbi:MAG: right-handed parallel beta-helix repeat-containing protein [Mangrovibacterium sp.]